MDMTTRSRFSNRFDWAFFFFWLVATTLGWLAGGFFAPGVAIIASGIAIGGMQWLVLRGRLQRSSDWFPATGLSWAVGWGLLLLLNPTQSPFLTGLILGLSSGAAQWLVLRREVGLAGWWIIISVIGWTSGFALIPGLFTSGMIPAVITGTALELLLYNSGK